MVSYNTRWILHQFSGLPILLFRSLWVKFAFWSWIKLTSWKSVYCVIPSMTVLKISATQGIETTRIGSRADRSAGCPWGDVVWIFNRWWGTEFNLWNGYHSCSLPTMLGEFLFAKITHSSWVFSHKIDSSNSITTFAVTNLQIMSTATEVKVFPRPISSASSAPGISASHSHLRMSQMAQTWCTRNWVLDRPGIEYLRPGTGSSVDLRQWWVLSSLTAYSRHLCSNSLLIVLRTVFNTEQVFAGSRISSLSCTYSWISVAPLSVFFLP